ncbi:MAG: zinc-ribbon domain-containing protein [Elusimicrobiota bacterium]
MNLIEKESFKKKLNYTKNILLQQKEVLKLTKYCIECGKELSDMAKFCSGCGKPQDELIEQKKQEQREEIQESTGPAALDLKAGINLIIEVENYIENAEVTNKSEFKEMEKRLFSAEKIINKAKSTDPTVEVLIPGTNVLINCDKAFAYNDYIGGRLGFDIACDINMGRASKVRAFTRAQTNFKTSLDRDPNPEVAFYYARAMHEELLVKTGTTIMPQGKLKQEVIEAYQYVIDAWPNSEWAVEARKYQTRLQ